MNVEEFRDYCLSLEGVDEKIPFRKFSKRYESILVFYVKNHMFCLTDIDNFTFIELVASPETSEKLQDRHLAVSKPINPTLKNWIHIDLNKDLSDKIIFQLISKAYDIIKSRYDKKSVS